MVKTRIIPCLDVKDGRVVKGINFLNLIDAGDPVEQVKHYSDNGADEICFLDISASLENRDTMVNVVKKTANEVFIPLTVGGGISSIENIQALLKAGADKVSINSAAIKNPNIIKLSSDRLPKYDFGQNIEEKIKESLEDKNNKNLKYFYLVSLKDIEPGEEILAKYTFYQF